MKEHWPCREDGKDCDARQPGCQSKCLKMLTAQLCAEERRKTEKASRRTERDAVGTLIDDSIRRQRRKKKQY